MGHDTVDDMARIPDHHPIMVGRRIRALHLALGWNSRQFATMISVAPQKLNSWEMGDVMVPIAAAIKIAVVTGTNIEFVYQGRLDRIEPDLAVKVAERVREMDRG